MSGSNGAHSMISGTYGHLVFWRGFIENDSTKLAVENSKKFAKVYQLSGAKSPPPMKFINVSGKGFNTVYVNSFKFYEELNNIVQYQPNEGTKHTARRFLARFRRSVPCN
jgi:hypothetical protein